MHVTLVHVHVKHGHAEDFIEATRRNHEGSIEEAGNLRFDVLQSEDDPDRFILCEVYRTADDAAAHKRTEHYLAWKEAVQHWMASPRQGVRYRVVAPQDPGQW